MPFRLYWLTISENELRICGIFILELMKSLFNLDMQDDRAFRSVISKKVIDLMNREALAFPKMYTGLLGSKLEDKVVEVLQQCAVGTCF